MKSLQYTINDIPEEMDSYLRDYALREAKSLNTVVLEAIKQGINIFRNHPKNPELRQLAGTWVEDEKSKAAFAAMDTVDEEMWR